MQNKKTMATLFVILLMTSTAISLSALPSAYAFNTATQTAIRSRHELARYDMLTLQQTEYCYGTDSTTESQLGHF